MTQNMWNICSKTTEARVMNFDQGQCNMMHPPIYFVAGITNKQPLDPVYFFRPREFLDLIKYM